MPSLDDMPLELLAHILSFVPAYMPVRRVVIVIFSVLNNRRFVQADASQFDASAAVPFAQKWRLRAVSRAFHCAWHTRRAWRGTRWHLTLRREDYGKYFAGSPLAAEWTALLQRIAHLLPDGFLDSIERAYRPQFRQLSIDAMLVEVRSFGAHVLVETLDMQPLPNTPFATHLLHQARHIGIKGRVSHATVTRDNHVLLGALA